MKGLDTPLANCSPRDDGGTIAILSVVAFELLVGCRLLRLIVDRAHLLISCLNIEAVFIVLDIWILLV